MKIVTIFKSDPQSRQPDEKMFESMGKLTCDLHEVGETPKFGP